MIDLRKTIAAKSDQLTADDLVAGPLTIRITDVAVNEGEQPVTINFDGDAGKPYKPGKSMRRVLVNLWGPDASQYIGRTLTLYRDENVKFGGVAVGGIRISHMSHIEREMTLALAETKKKKATFTIRPLVETDKVAEGVKALIAKIKAAETREALDAVLSSAAKQREWLAANRPELAALVSSAIAERE